MQDLRSADRGRSSEAVERYLSLLKAGGSDYPMNLLARAGVDLSQPDTVRAVGDELEHVGRQAGKGTRVLIGVVSSFSRTHRPSPWSELDLPSIDS